MGYFQPDLTASDPAYRITDHFVYIYTTNQTIEFPIPIYSESLKIFKIGPSGIETELPISEWEKGPVDTTTLGYLKVANPDFDKELIKSIIIKNTSNEKFLIRLDYQQLYPNYIDYNYYYSASQLEVTPQLIAELLDTTRYLRDVIDNKYIPDTFTIEAPKTKILEEDPNKSNPNNFIQNEIHKVNTYEGRNLIFPVFGAFFKDSLIVRNNETGQKLNYGTDYLVLGLDITKTRISQNPSGIYTYIKIIKEFIGEISIDYHAYGGVPSIQNYNEILQKVYNISNYLNQHMFVTVDVLPKHKTIINILNRLTALEADMRKLLGGLPTYADVTDKISITKKIRSVSDLLHWWTIATLYKVEGSESPCMADTFTFKLQTLNSPLLFECSIAFNALNAEDKFTVKVLSDNLDESLVEKYQPSIRILWNQEEGTWSGALLQIGLRLVDYQIDTLAIEDRSGKESCFILIPNTNETTDPEDDNLTLPNGSIWSSTLDVSKSVTLPLPLINGGVIKTSSSPLTITINNPTTGNYDFSSTDFLKYITQAKFYFTLEENNEYTSYKIIAYIDEINGIKTVKKDMILDDGRVYYLTVQFLSNNFTITIIPKEEYGSHPTFRLDKIAVWYGG